MQLGFVLVGLALMINAAIGDPVNAAVTFGLAGGGPAGVSNLAVVAAPA